MNVARLTTGLKGLLDFCYPPRCAGCDAAVAPHGDTRGVTPRSADAGPSLCDACLKEMEGLESVEGCSRCGMPLPGGGVCPYCVGKGLTPYRRVVRLGVYRDPLRRMIWRMKYEGSWPLAEGLADRLIESRGVHEALAGADCLLAVPLHWMRRIERGYNQSEVIAQRIARRCGVRLVHPVVRLRYTATQTQVSSQAKRVENLRDAFGLIDEKSIRGRHVWVVDDVRTTGATLQAVGRELRQAKPASLSAIVLAVADPRGRDFTAI